MRFRPWFSLLLLALWTVCCCGPVCAEQVIKIGVIVPLSGDMAVHGVEIRRAMELAQSELGTTRHQYQLLFEDNRLEGAKSVTAARRLIDVEQADCIVTLACISWPGHPR